jgi:hypothetical protein
MTPYPLRDDEYIYNIQEVVSGPPPGSIAFNPSAAIQLPSVAAGEVVIFETIVPLGFDGIILGQFHQYAHNPAADPGNVHNFTEGSGDIAWRIAADNRYVRDCGNMLVSIGQEALLSPIAGGIQLRSRNRVQYRVQVYNLSGVLVAGLGSIIAGLHGYFYPRK